MLDLLRFAIAILPLAAYTNVLGLLKLRMREPMRTAHLREIPSHINICSDDRHGKHLFIRVGRGEVFSSERRGL